MKNVPLLLTIFPFCLMLAVPAHASFIGDSITGTGIQGGGDLFFPDNLITTSNDAIEFTGAPVGIFNPDAPNPDPIDTISLEFDFLDTVDDTLLVLYAHRPCLTGGTWEFTDLVVTFTGLDYSDSDFILAGFEQMPTDVLSPYYANPMQGFMADYGDDWIQLTFTNFRVFDTRGIDFKLIFEEVDGGPLGSVVPVPAAAPMALLGIGAIALARRFRRSKS